MQLHETLFRTAGCCLSPLIFSSRQRSKSAADSAHLVYCHVLHDYMTNGAAAGCWWILKIFQKTANCLLPSVPSSSLLTSLGVQILCCCSGRNAPDLAYVPSTDVSTNELSPSALWDGIQPIRRANGSHVHDTGSRNTSSPRSILLSGCSCQW